MKYKTGPLLKRPVKTLQALSCPTQLTSAAPLLWAVHRTSLSLASCPICSGICLGAQLLAHALGGKVATHRDGICEFGYEPIHAVNDAKLAKNHALLIGTNYMVQAHFQGFSLPPGCTMLATGDNFTCQSFIYKHNVFAFQFHPELHHEMFVAWQNSDWKDEFYATPGARPASQQLTDNDKYNQIQTDWFKNFLDKVLPPLPQA